MEVSRIKDLLGRLKSLKAREREILASGNFGWDNKVELQYIEVELGRIVEQLAKCDPTCIDPFGNPRLLPALANAGVLF